MSKNTVDVKKNKFKKGQKVFYICDKNYHADITYLKQYKIIKVIEGFTSPWDSDIIRPYTLLEIEDDAGDIESYDIEFFSHKKPDINIKTYTENDDFPSYCWFADWQPRDDLTGTLNGNIVIRRRDDCSTTCLIDIPVGGRRGISEDVAEKITDSILRILAEDK